MITLKLSRFNLLKSALIGLLMASALLMSGSRVEAANTSSVSWQHTYTTQDCVNALPVVSVDSWGNPLLDSLGNPIYTYYMADSWGNYTVPVPSTYTITPVWDYGYVGGTLNGYQACSPPYSVVDSSFSASDTKDTYAPGESITVTVSAATGNQGSNWHGVWGAGVIGCFLFGCSSPPLVGVGAYPNGIKAVYVEGHGSAGPGSGTFTASVTPGSYSIPLNGCINNAQSCAAASLNFTVVAPVPVINGACSSPAVHYTCASGTGDNQGNVNGFDTNANWNWNCVGSNGGTNAACSQSKSCVWSGGNVGPWSVDCNASYTATTISNGGSTGPINNTVAGYTGSVSFSCSDGVWSAVSPTCAATTPVTTTVPLPTASLTIDGVHSETLVPNQSNTKTWSSTNGTSWSSTYSFSGSCSVAGATGPWIATIASGSSTTTVSPSYVGCIATITYTVSNSAGSVSDTIYATVAAPVTTTPVTTTPVTTTPVTTTPVTTTPAPAPAPAPTCASNQGTSCASSPNFCGQTNISSIQCDGSCPASTPSDSLCPTPTVSISASPNRVRTPGTSLISWSSTYANSCTVTKNGSTFSSSLNSPPTADTITAQSQYQLACTGPGGSGSASASAIVNVVPSFQEF